MRPRKVGQTLAALLAVGAVAGFPGHAVAEAPEDLPAPLHGMYDLLGQPAPDFALDAAGGGSVSLADLRKGNRVIIIQLWASWCVPCHIETLILKQMAHRFSPDDLVIVGLHANDSSVEMIPEIRGRLGMDFPVAVATDAVWQAYGDTPLLPTSVIIGRSGRVRRVELGVKWVNEVDPMLRALVAETVEEAKAAPVSDGDLDWGGNEAAPAAAPDVPGPATGAGM